MAASVTTAGRSVELLGELRTARLDSAGLAKAMTAVEEHLQQLAARLA